jgi:hypothetical protein
MRKLLRLLAFITTALLVATMHTAEASAVSTEANEAPTDVELVQATEIDDETLMFEAGDTTLQVEAADVLQPQEVVPASASRAITCSLGVHNPHPSSHVNGTINGTAKITCSGKAGSMALSYSLIRVSPKNKQWGAGLKKNTNKSTLSNNRAVSCKEGSGRFQGWAQGVIKPPAGYKLSGPATYSKYGKTIWVGCGNGPKPVSESTSQIGEEITITFVPTKAN